MTVSSYGGSVTHRTEINLPDGASSRSHAGCLVSTPRTCSPGWAPRTTPRIISPGCAWRNWTSEPSAGSSASHAPNLAQHLVRAAISISSADVTLAPSAQGNLELAAAGGIVGLQNTGAGPLERPLRQRLDLVASINVSDASPASIPGIATPLAYQSVTGRDRVAAVQSHDRHPPEREPRAE